MKKCVGPVTVARSVLGTALAALLLPAAAEDVVLEQSVSVGAAAASGDQGDRAQFGQYNGHSDRNSAALLDFDYYRRDDEHGLLTHLQGLNLLGETRALDLLWKKQGDWQFSAGYRELVRVDPYRLNTGMQGAGSTNPQVVHLAGGPGSGSEIDLETERKRLELGVSKWFANSLQFDFTVKSENKDGEQLFGRGMNCPSPIAPGCAPTTGISPGWAVLALPRPVDANHTQVEARLTYARDKLRINGGYYGSFFNAATGALEPDVPASLNNAVGQPGPLNTGLQPLLNQPIALWPDNEAHQVHVAGLYSLTPTTQARFKLGHALARQDERFASAGLGGAPGGVTDLAGEVRTTTVVAGVTSRPQRNLSLLAEAKLEDKDDDTPIETYNVEGDASYTNRNYSRTRLRSKLQAAYRFSSEYRGLLAVERDAIDRGNFTATSAVSGVNALRSQTHEMIYRAELQRRMSAQLSGALKYEARRRDGSNWQRPNSGVGVTDVDDAETGLPSTAVFAPTLADRRRDQMKVSANWQATEDLALQFAAHYGLDRYDTPTDLGLRDSRTRFVSVDWSYALSRRTNLTGYASYGSQALVQARPEAYIMAFDNTTTTFGLGFTASPTRRLDIGGSLAMIEDRSSYDQTLDAAASANAATLLAATGGLPDIVFRRIELKLTGSYDVSKASKLSAELIHLRTEYDDWAYTFDGTPFLYSDNTTVIQQAGQSVSFLVLRYAYRWH
ncbi:MAG: MtrB/PioB family decaheme-associated outer membrane protein [Rhodocyclaceae bacterium]|nr:MtrB/PioB family decaheme-associated outer membrane protein [Rhodocyclaceae bacterium]